MTKQTADVVSTSLVDMPDTLLARKGQVQHERKHDGLCSHQWHAGTRVVMLEPSLARFNCMSA